MSWGQCKMCILGGAGRAELGMVQDMLGAPLLPPCMCSNICPALFSLLNKEWGLEVTSQEMPAKSAGGSKARHPHGHVRSGSAEVWCSIQGCGHSENAEARCSIHGRACRLLRGSAVCMETRRHRSAAAFATTDMFWGGGWRGMSAHTDGVQEDKWEGELTGARQHSGVDPAHALKEASPSYHRAQRRGITSPQRPSLPCLPTPRSHLQPPPCLLPPLAPLLPPLLLRRPLACCHQHQPGQQQPWLSRSSR